MSNVNRRQFRQTRLFAPLGMMKQPHQMTPIEFANSPRTMIHGSDHEDFEGVRDSAHLYDQGFHVGTPQAANERLTTRHMSAVEGYYHPVRPLPGVLSGSGGSGTRDRPIEDMGDEWDESHFGHYYRNQYEDKDSLSAVVESPHDVKHYADYVHDALDRGGIPSGAGEHFATQLDSVNRHTEGSPGIPRGMMAVRKDEVENAGMMLPGQIRSRIEPRQDLYDSPSARVWGRSTDGEQRSMFMNRRTYTDDGWPKADVLVPAPDALPNEAAVQRWHAEDSERSRPFMERLAREGHLERPHREDKR